jgi:hypothetical protein
LGQADQPVNRPLDGQGGSFQGGGPLAARRALTGDTGRRVRDWVGVARQLGPGDWVIRLGLAFTWRNGFTCQAGVRRLAILIQVGAAQEFGLFTRHGRNDLLWVGQIGSG